MGRETLEEHVASVGNTRVVRPALLELAVGVTDPQNESDDLSKKQRLFQKRNRAFSCDVIAAMLEGKNNTFSLPWEMDLFSLFQPSNMAAVKTLYSCGSTWRKSCERSKSIKHTKSTNWNICWHDMRIWYDEILGAHSLSDFWWLVGTGIFSTSYSQCQHISIVFYEHLPTQCPQVRNLNLSFF